MPFQMDHLAAASQENHSNIHPHSCWFPSQRSAAVPLEEYQRLKLPGLPAPVPLTDKLMDYNIEFWLKPASCPLLSHSQLVAVAVLNNELVRVCSITLKSNHFLILIFYMALTKHCTLEEYFIRGQYFMRAEKNINYLINILFLSLL